MDDGHGARERLLGRRPCPRAACAGRRSEFRIVGLFGFGNRADFGAVTFAAFDLRTAQKSVRGAGDRSTGSTCRRDPGVATGVVQARLERALGGRYDVLTADGGDRSRSANRCAASSVSSRTRCSGFAAIGVVVGAFVIFNTFTILVTQRTRELGLLRAMGATGSQVVWSVVLEAFVVGVGRVGDRSGRSASRSGSGCSSCCARSGSSFPRRRSCCSVARSWCHSPSA